jgi:hypothetical protein
MSEHHRQNLLAALRGVGHNPPRTLAEALRAAERQAKKLLLLTETYEPPVDPAILLADPKIELRYTAELHNVSGACRWVGSRYVIAINMKEPVPRQRFTIFHELKHAIDGAATTAALERMSRRGRRPAPEYVADYFAACILMPEPWVVDAVRHAEDVSHLARYFGVSKDAMRVRLELLGLDRRFSRATV